MAQRERSPLNLQHRYPQTTGSVSRCKGESPTVLNGTGTHRIARDFPLTPRRGQVYPDNTLCRRGSEWITVIYSISPMAGSNPFGQEKWAESTVSE